MEQEKKEKEVEKTEKIERMDKPRTKTGHRHKEKDKDKTKLYWKSDLDYEVIIENFTDRNWEETDDDEKANIYWTSVVTVIDMYNLKNELRVSDHQVISHFPNFFEISRKDSMAMNIKKYKRNLIKEGKESYDTFNDIIPVTYILPYENQQALDEFKQGNKTLWIIKPSNKCQGQGISMTTKLAKLKKIISNLKTQNEIPESKDKAIDTYVISKYITNPFLVGNKKFDMRIYCLVTSFRPIKAYLYQKGFCRFCNEKFSMKAGDIDNIYIHLTNVAVQKRSDQYSSSHGGKWNLQNLKFYLENLYGYDKTKKCFDEIKNVIITSLKSVNNVIFNDKHCFECYGYDILIDDNLKPWLIEINSSPSLSTTTKGDFILKKKLISDVLDIVINEKWIESKGKVGTSSFTGTNLGFFDLLYDETLEIKKKEESAPKKKGDLPGGFKLFRKKSLMGQGSNK